MVVRVSGRRNPSVKCQIIKHRGLSVYREGGGIKFSVSIKGGQNFGEMGSNMKAGIHGILNSVLGDQHFGQPEFLGGCTKANFGLYKGETENIED